MGTRTFTKEFLVNELDLPSNAIEDKIVDTGRWSEHHEIVFEHAGKFYRTHYSCGATEQQDERPWEYEEEVECYEVKLAKVMKEEYVGIDYVEEQAPVADPTPMQHEFLINPPADVSPVALWAFYNKAEKEAEKHKKAAAKVALAEVKKTKDKFVKTQFGGAQMINKELKKPADSLKFLLQQKGYYELCRTDAVDLTKVNELVESGALDEAEINKHVEINTSTYLQIKNKK